jgi:cytochrome P450
MTFAHRLRFRARSVSTAWSGWRGTTQGFYRTATRDYTVGAQTIPAGARVLSVFAAANRDPRCFDDPDSFDLNRNRPTTSPSVSASTAASACRCPVWKPAGSIANYFCESMPFASTATTGTSTTR